MKSPIWAAIVPFAAMLMAGCDGAGSGASIDPDSAKSATKESDIRGTGPESKLAARSAVFSNYTGGPISYAIDAVPSASSYSKIFKTIDTATRIWHTAYNVGNEDYADYLFYEVPSSSSPTILFTYEDTDYPTIWDVRSEGSQMKVVMHPTVNKKAIDWSNQGLMYFFISNVIGVDVMGMPSSPSDQTSLRWRPAGGLSGVTEFPHLPNMDDLNAGHPGSWTNWERSSVGSRPLFTKRIAQGAGYEFVIGWDSARKYEKIGYGIAFRGRINLYSNSSQYNHSKASVSAYQRYGTPSIGYSLNGTQNWALKSGCWDRSYIAKASYALMNKLNFTIFGDRTDGEGAGVTWNNGLGDNFKYAEFTPLYTAYTSSSLGYQIVYGKPMTGCQEFLGYLQTGRGLESPNPDPVP